MDTHLRLPSCSRMLWRVTSLREKVVALGLGLVVMAWAKKMPASSGSAFRASIRAPLSVSASMSRPSRGRKPWFAKVLSPGHGPRTGLEVSTLAVRSWPLTQRFRSLITIIRTWGLPLVLGGERLAWGDDGCRQC